MRMRALSLVAVVAAVAAVQTVPATAGHRHHGWPDATDRVIPLEPSTHGNPEGVTWHEPSRTFFVGSTGDGTIYRGRVHDRTLRPFIPVDPTQGRSAVGMAAVGGKLYVAGGRTGKVFVYRIRTRHLVGTFDTGSGGFLNDLAVTDAGDVYVTDSFRAVLWQLTRAQVRAGTGSPTPIDVSPQIDYQAGFNLNGIVWAGQQEFLTIQSSTGLVYRIKLDPAAPGGRQITQLAAAPVMGGDGLFWDRGRLIIVDGEPASLTFMALTTDLKDGHVTKVRTSSALRGASTLARAQNRYVVVNADFDTNTTPFTVATLKAPHRHPVWELPNGGEGWLADDLKARH